MNETIHDRISSLVNIYGDGKNTVFANKVGVSEGNIRGYVKGIMPKQDVLAKIVRCCDGVSPLWLLTGEGPMLLKTDPEPSEKETESDEKVSKLKNSRSGLENSRSGLEDSRSVLDNSSPSPVAPRCHPDISERLLDELTAQRRMFESALAKTNELCDRLMTLLEKQGRQ